MNINKSNFSELYPQIAAQIKQCDLVAFDLEYSGIKLVDQNNYSLFDTIEDRYNHIKSCAQSFTTFQLGIVLFTRRLNDKTILLNNCSKFSSISYNIDLFPMGSDLFDTTFICSAAALKFLRNHDMNVNDIIDNGVGFLNSEEFLQLRNKFDSYSNIHSVLSEDQERVLEQQRKIVADWLKSLKDVEVEDQGDKSTKCNYQIHLPSVPGLSSYFQQMFLRSHFTEISTGLTSDKKILVQKVSITQRFEIDQKEDDFHATSEKYKFCMEMSGVSKIWKLISRLKKPIVGHNCLFDLITIYQKFFSPLPDTFDEFKFELHRSLPTIYDTKFIFGRMRMNFKELAEIEGGLESVFQSLHQLNLNNKERGVTIEEENIESLSNDNRIDKVRSCQAHEAGYDAFMTGCCLIYLSNILYKSQLSDCNSEEKPKRDNTEINVYEKSAKKFGVISVASFDTYEACLKSWKNYVNVIRAHEFCVCFDQLAVDDGYRTASGNRLMNTRPPWLIIYDRNPRSELVCNTDDLINEENRSTEDDDCSSSNMGSSSESCFSQAFLEQLLFEFGDANIKKFGKVTDDEKYQKFLVALPSYNILRSFKKNMKRRWPRLVVREYSRLQDDTLSKTLFLAATATSTVVSAWAIFSLIKELQ